MSEEKKTSKSEQKKLEGQMIAKKAFEIHQNDYHKVIKKGDDLSDVPKVYWPNLKTEGVI